MRTTVKTGTRPTLRIEVRNAAGALADAEGALTLLLIDPKGGEAEYKAPTEITHDGPGKYSKAPLIDKSGLWHFRWLINGQVAEEGEIEAESAFDVEFTESEAPDLTDLRVLVPRAKRKVEGPWGNPAGRAELTPTQIYEMVADACGEIVMLSGSFFHHTLNVKTRDPLGGYPTEWQTDTPLTEWEGAVICAQVALNYYYYLLRDMKISETIQNEGTQWTYDLSANVLRTYLEEVKAERDLAIAGLRVNIPVLDRWASNIRVRDQATVTALEWWDINSPGLSGTGLPGGQEASVVPWFPGSDLGGF